MYYLCKSFVAFILMTLIFSTAEAQINPVYKIMRQRGWSSHIENGKTKLSSSQLNEESLISMGYNDTIITNLQKIGVDLLSLQKASVPWNAKILAAISDCIIIGKVSKIEHPEGLQWFHSVAYVQVEKFLRNDYNIHLGQLPIMIVSSPTRTLVGEDTLGIGEHGLLFLSANSLIRFAANNDLHNLFNKLINDSKINFEIIAKFDISSGKVISHNRAKDLANVSDDIKTVLTTIHRNLSINK